jgi:hypothetical protein
MTKKVIKHLRAKIFAGILVILPLGITFLILKFVFNTLDSILDPLIPDITISLFNRLIIPDSESCLPLACSSDDSTNVFYQADWMRRSPLHDNRS